MAEVCARGDLPDLDECGEVQQTRGSIFVGNIPDGLDLQILRDIFESKGVQVLYVEMKMNFAFIHCNLSDTLKEIVADMKGHKLKCGRVLSIEMAKGDGEVKRREDERKKNQAASTTLFVVGFDTTQVSEKDISNAFSAVAPVQKVMIRKSFCFARFKSIEDATTVMMEFHGKELLGRVISIEYGMLGGGGGGAGGGNDSRRGSFSPSRFNDGSNRNMKVPPQGRTNRDYDKNREDYNNSSNLNTNFGRRGSENNKNNRRDSGESGVGRKYGSSGQRFSGGNYDDYGGESNGRNRSRSRSRDRSSRMHNDRSTNKSVRKNEDKVRVLYEHPDGRKEYVDAILCAPNNSDYDDRSRNRSNRDTDRNRDGPPRRGRYNGSEVQESSVRERSGSGSDRGKSNRNDQNNGQDRFRNRNKKSENGRSNNDDYNNGNGYDNDDNRGRDWRLNKSNSNDGTNFGGNRNKSNGKNDYDDGRNNDDYSSENVNKYDDDDYSNKNGDCRNNNNDNDNNDNDNNYNDDNNDNNNRNNKNDNNNDNNNNNNNNNTYNNYNDNNDGNEKNNNNNNNNNTNNNSHRNNNFQKDNGQSSKVNTTRNPFFLYNDKSKDQGKGPGSNIKKSYIESTRDRGESNKNNNSTVSPNKSLRMDVELENDNHDNGDYRPRRRIDSRSCS